MKGDQLFYVGTYTKGRKEGISLCRVNSGGVITVEREMAAGPNPSYLATNSQRRRLYVVNEMPDNKEEQNGAVSAFVIEPESYSLRFLNRQPSGGTAPCHITVDQSDRFVLAANYGSGSVVVSPINADGSLRPASELAQHTGSGANPKRQQGPHAHCVAMSRDNRFVYVADLGIDKVMVYRFDQQAGILHPAEPHWAQLPPGTGPRHLAFDRTGKHMYLINELSPTMDVYSVDVSSGALRHEQTVATVPDGFTGENYGAEVYPEPSGRFVYGSNRGHNSIVVFAVEEKTGKLALLQHQSTEGNWPRDFAVDPSGEFLLVANERSDSITVFAIDSDTGRLTSTGHRALIPSPVCIRFI